MIFSLFDAGRCKVRLWVGRVPSAGDKPSMPARIGPMVVAFLLVMIAPMEASAHRFAPSVLRWEEVADQQFSVTWKTPIQQVSDIALVPVIPDGCRVTLQSPWIQEGTGKLRQSTLACEGPLTGTSIAVNGLAENQASVLLNVIALDGVSHQAVLTAEAPGFLVPEEPDRWAVVSRYSVLGAEHIWAGVDHLLFVLGLLLLVGHGRRLIWTITAFTVGHSITLAMVTLGLFDYPVALIEFLIALSIFVLAIELSRTSGHSRLWRQPWWLAGVFGLLHGMGFAGALAETGLPPNNLPLALLFFNVGIELGQLAFIAVLLLIGHFVVRLLRERAEPLAQVPVLVLGALSAMWCIQRGLEVIG